MRSRYVHPGLTLTEMVVVIATIALLATLGLPAIRALLGSFETNSSTRDMISTSLSGARAIAAREQRYAGVRFQMDSAGNQYMIHIIHDPERTNLSSGFRAVDSLKPMKLPEHTRVADLIVRTDHSNSSAVTDDPNSITAGNLDDTNQQNLDTDGKNIYVTDISTFSIIFSPTGKLVIHQVRVRNEDGIYQPDNSVATQLSEDDIFNSPENIENLEIGMFIQDDYAERGLGAELSRNNLIIYDKIQFDKLDAQEKYDYLKSIEPIYINSYTGTMISSRP